MKKLGILALTLGGLLNIGSVSADEIFSEAKGRSSAKATAGVMIGAGALFADGTLSVAGDSGRAYGIGTDRDKVKTVRSPKRVFAVGDKVEIRGNRPYPKKSKATALAML